VSPKCLFDDQYVHQHYCLHSCLSASLFAFLCSHSTGWALFLGLLNGVLKKVRYITSRNMLTCGYQLQHRLLHFDVATFIQRFLFFTIVHRFANLLCEVIRSESADNLKPGQICILSQFKFTEWGRERFKSWLTLNKNLLLTGFDFGPLGSGK
jgi:hypothetical protein